MDEEQIDREFLQRAAAGPSAVPLPGTVDGGHSMPRQPVPAAGLTA
ncbi:hypothetical protein [Thermomonospora umbrina]|nr:hypothetical protein [Thermomonospora umbrina]